jgi:hypothetical protein
VATHPRKTIREKVVTLLSAGVVGAGGRVYDSREKQPVATGPFVVVKTILDQSPPEDQYGLSLPTYQRQLELEVHCVETGRPTSGTLAGDADDLAREVEEYLADYVDLDGLVLTCLLTASTMEEGLDVDPPAFRVVLTYQVIYEDALGN